MGSEAKAMQSTLIATHIHINVHTCIHTTQMRHHSFTNRNDN